MMKAVAVFPGKPHTVHLEQLSKPLVDAVPNGRGVLVKILRVGVGGVDREVGAAEYGSAPEGFDFLVMGHENFGRVEAVGPNVTEFERGDYVVAVVRRPGPRACQPAGAYDVTAGGTSVDCGVNRRHGYLTEYYVDDPEYVVKVPRGLKGVGVLLAPLAAVEADVAQAYEIQRRLRVWRPRRAAVMGAGITGLLATLALRLRGLQVTTFAHNHRTNLNARLIEAVGGHYQSATGWPTLGGAKKYGAFDLIFETTGLSPVAFECMRALGPDGVIVLTGMGVLDRRVEVPVDRASLELSLANKVMVGTINPNREHFEMGARDMAYAEAEYPGWLARLLTHPVEGLENLIKKFDELAAAKDAIKVFCKVADYL